jgi:phospholipid transport system substrate-binding protein
MKTPSRYALLAIALLFGIAAVAARAEETPDATIKHAVDEVTAAINADKAIQAGNREKITALVDSKIVPYVNVERMTQSAVGPNWAKATPEQQQQLMQQFKLLVTNTYSGAFSGYRPDTKIDYKPFRMAPGDTTAVVRSVVTGSKGDQIPIDYYLEKSGNDWKVVDLSVYNARLVELYKSQFSSAIASSGIDGLIKTLAAKNHSNDSAGKS